MLNPIQAGISDFSLGARGVLSTVALEVLESLKVLPPMREKRLGERGAQRYFALDETGRKLSHKLQKLAQNSRAKNKAAGAFFEKGLGLLQQQMEPTAYAQELQQLLSAYGNNKRQSFKSSGRSGPSYENKRNGNALRQWNHPRASLHCWR